MFQPILHRLAYRGSDTIPMDSKDLGYHVPSSPFPPRGQQPQQPHAQATLAFRPRDLFHPNLSALGTIDASGTINQSDLNAPKRNMLPTPLRKSIPNPPQSLTMAAGQLSPAPRTQVNFDSLNTPNLSLNAMPLDSQGLFQDINH
jgi:hypothetical protein